MTSLPVIPEWALSWFWVGLGVLSFGLSVLFVIHLWCESRK